MMLDGTDPTFVPIGEVYAEVHLERVRAHRKHYPNSRELAKWDDAEWLAILGEEYGEVCHELTYDRSTESPKYARIRAELVQVAAMACAWIDAIDRSFLH